MPGSLLTPRDALSDRSEASYGSADSRASAKKVSFNRAVRVKQYPWTPDDNHLQENGTAPLLSLPSRRFWFKVYKVKAPQLQNGDHWRDQNGGSTCNGHYSQPHPTNSWEEGNAEDTYDSLAPIVEDDGIDHDDKNHQHSNGLLHDQYPFRQNQVNDVVSKFSGETAVQRGKETEMNDTRRYTKHPSDLSGQAMTKNPVINGFKAVLAKSQAKLKGERSDASCRKAPQSDVRSDRHYYRAVSPPKQSGVSNATYARNGNSEKFIEADDKSTIPVKIPRAESPRRGSDGNERFSMRYKTHQRRSRSTGDTTSTTRNEGGIRKLTSTDKSVSTDDLESSEYHDKGGLSWINRSNKDKSTQCNGTLIRSKPLTAYGTPRLSRSSFSNLLKRDESGDKRGHNASQNGNFKVKSDPPVNASKSFSLNGRSADESSNSRCAKSFNQFESCARSNSSEPRKTVNQIITKPRIAMNCYRSQNSKINGPDVSREVYAGRENRSQEPTNSNSCSSTGDHSVGLIEVKSTGLPFHERRRGLTVVPEEHPSRSKQHWSNNTPLAERRASSWERGGTRPAAATVGYHGGRHIASQRLRVDECATTSSFDTGQNGGGASPPQARERNRLMAPTRGDTSRSALHASESTQNSREFSSSASQLKNSSVAATACDARDMIDWSLSGFQLGPPTVDRGLASDSECFVHQRPPLLMYIPGVSHHEKPALEEDRMSGMSGISRADVDDDLRPLTNSCAFNRRNSMPKDSNRSWGVKWKALGKPSRQP